MSNNYNTPLAKLLLRNWINSKIRPYSTTGWTKVCVKEHQKHFFFFFKNKSCIFFKNKSNNIKRISQNEIQPSPPLPPLSHLIDSFFIAFISHNPSLRIPPLPLLSYHPSPHLTPPSVCGGPHNLKLHRYDPKEAELEAHVPVERMPTHPPSRSHKKVVQFMRSEVWGLTCGTVKGWRKVMWVAFRGTKMVGCTGENIRNNKIHKFWFLGVILVFGFGFLGFLGF